MRAPLGPWEDHPSLGSVRRYAEGGRIALSLANSFSRQETRVAVHRDDGTVAARLTASWTARGRILRDVRELYLGAS